MSDEGLHPTFPSNPSIGATPHSDETQPILGQMGQFDLLFKLGEGGMGQVYKARHRLMDQVVALKLIHSNNLNRTDALDRFHREIRALSKLTHPNIVRAQYADVVDGKHFLVMEYVPGPNLAEVIRDRGPLPINEACSYIRQAALGLHHAHLQGLVHRDIKPSNLLVAPGGLVKILDLGLALIREGPAEATEELTATGQVFGTYDYMAPEQWDDSHTVDIRADLYSLGCTLYFLLTGRAPFSGPEFDTALRKMKAHTQKPIPSMRSVRLEVPELLDELVMKLLAKNPDDRLKDPAQVAAALQPFTEGFAGPPDPSTSTGSVTPSNMETKTLSGRTASSYTTGRKSLKRMLLGVAGVLVAVGLVAGLGYWKFHKTPAPPEDSGPEATPSQPLLPLKVVKFEILHYRVRENRMMDPVRIDALGKKLPVHLGDRIRLEVGLSEPAHAFILALTPDGTRRLLFPLENNVSPPEAKDFVFPVHARNHFSLVNGIGLEAFLFIASRKPLPPFEEFKNSLGRLPWKSNLRDDIGFYFDGTHLDMIGSRRSPGPRSVNPVAEEDQTALEQLRDHLLKLPNIDVAAFLAIPVESVPIKK